MRFRKAVIAATLGTLCLTGCYADPNAPKSVITLRITTYEETSLGLTIDAGNEQAVAYDDDNGHPYVGYVTVVQTVVQDKKKRPYYDVIIKVPVGDYINIRVKISGGDGDRIVCSFFKNGTEDVLARQSGDADVVCMYTVKG